MEHRTRPRSSYNNKKSYDDELSLVLELLELAKEYENELVELFEEALEELCELYEDEFPFYFKSGPDQKSIIELMISLIKEGDFETNVSRVLDTIRERTLQLETQRLTAWLILDYELTKDKTANSVGLPTEQLQYWVEKNPVKQVIEKPWCPDNKTYLDRIKDATNTMDKQLRLVIIQGYKRGWSKERMTEIFRNITGTAEYKARRLIRTETMAVWSKVTKGIYLEKGIELVEIIGDAACGGICTDYVGEIVPLADAELGDDLPPYHPNCACSFCSYTEFADVDEDN